MDKTPDRELPCFSVLESNVLTIGRPGIVIYNRSGRKMRLIHSYYEIWKIAKFIQNRIYLLLTFSINYAIVWWWPFFSSFLSFYVFFKYVRWIFYRNRMVVLHKRHCLFWWNHLVFFYGAACWNWLVLALSLYIKLNGRLYLRWLYLSLVHSNFWGSLY